MKLTCVTATFNAIAAGRREQLIRCVNSVAQLKTEHEHLIYDGASTDGTVELLRELEKSTPGVKVVSEKDTGIYNALNKGVRDASGEWFYVLGCDDYICSPEVLDRLVKDLTDDDDALVTTVDCEQPDGRPVKWFTSLRDLDQAFYVGCACHQGTLLRTSIARELGGFNEKYRIVADFDMLFKAHLANRKFKYVFEVFASFGYAGLCSVCENETRREHRENIADIFGLQGKVRRMIVERRIMPYGVCIKLWNHQDLMVRSTARAMVAKRVRAVLRIVLYPIVVITRPIRHCCRSN